MIISRAPVRISFLGGGSDMPNFYHLFPGKVISTTIDKYVYVVLNPAPLLEGIHARYSINENVTDVKKIKNDHIREALLDLNISDNLEIAIFSDLPTEVGLGGSSSFAVALYKALYAYLGDSADKDKLAEKACRLELDLLKQPIGKQDQYAAAQGGFNVYNFMSNEQVVVNPLFLDYKKRFDLENHLLLFYTGITPSASILKQQSSNIKRNIDDIKQLANNVDVFQDLIIKGYFHKAGLLLHDNWLIKKKLAYGITNPIINQFYDTGIAQGAWGGKILGAGGGGCVLFFTPTNKRVAVRSKIKLLAQKLKLSGFREIPFKFVESGGEIIYNNMLHK